MLKYLNVYKPVGYTPLQLVQKVKEVYPEFTHTKIGYAGRLDPMAEGLLLLLIGDTNKQKKAYEGLDKIYEFELILGIETDSYDVLGIVQQSDHFPVEVPADKVQKALQSLLHKKEQEYPPFSSARVKGKPLFYWAYHNRLDEITIPKKKVQIFSIEIKGQRYIHTDELRTSIRKRISQVEGNFRQEEILAKWQDFFEKISPLEVAVYKCKVKCSSGTYVRGLVHELGNVLKTKATTLSIKRVAIGNYTVTDSIHLITEDTK